MIVLPGQLDRQAGDTTKGPAAMPIGVSQGAARPVGVI
jgi:hypothetical protein